MAYTGENQCHICGGEREESRRDKTRCEDCGRKAAADSKAYRARIRANGNYPPWQLEREKKRVLLRQIKELTGEVRVLTEERNLFRDLYAGVRDGYWEREHRKAWRHIDDLEAEISELKPGGEDSQPTKEEA